MCRPGRWIAVLLLAVAVAVDPLAGQETSSRAEAERELVERIDGLRESLERARVRSRAEDARNDSIRAARAAKNLDTLSVGPLRVVALDEQAEEARSVFAEEWEALRPWIGDDAVNLSEAFFLYDPTRDVGAVDLSTHYRITGRDWSDFSFAGAVVRRNIRLRVAEEVARQGPDVLRHWTGNLGPYSQPDEDVEDLYRRIVLRPSIATAACVAGEPGACWTALGLGTSADALSDWYTPAQAGMRVNRSTSWAMLTCRSEVPPEGCGEYLRDPRHWAYGIPADPKARADFLAFALRQGGEGALARLLEPLRRAEARVVEARDAEGTVEEDDDEVRDVRYPIRPGMTRGEFAEAMRAGLVAASGMDEESLVAAWRERLISSRPDVRAGAERTRAATFLWIVLLTVFATRSSRWRLG